MIRKALVTAGGRATRLRPITHTINKHLIPLANEPMLGYVLAKVAAAGITDVVLNVNIGEQEIQRYVGDGSRWGMRIRCVEQSGGPLGLAHIIRNAEPVLGHEPFLFLLGDNLILGDLRPLLEKFDRESLDACLAFVRVEDPRRFGVGEFRDGQLVRVVEKPEVPPSNLAQTGIYLYGPPIFDAAAAIPPSARGEYEISDANTWLLEHGHRVGWVEMTGWWKDTGRPEDLLEGNRLILSDPAFTEHHSGAILAEGVRVHGNVRIGTGSRLEGHTVIRGPATIGDRCVITDSYIGPYTAIGNDVTIADTEVEHSIVFKGASIRSSGRIVDSIIGHHATVAPTNGRRPFGHRLIVGDQTVVEI